MGTIIPKLQHAPTALHYPVLNRALWCGWSCDLVYFQLLLHLQVFFDDELDEENYCGYLFGLGNTYTSNGNGYTVTDASQ